MKIMKKRSTIGATPKQRKVLEALGLRKIRQVKEMPDNDAVRGMVKQVEHLVEVVD
ncbi:ribosomal protein L30 [Desulfovibrio sp. X2]|uniref:50S ribosomal protein L30 n=1 Tax=Desulfovibrio sp. X2 TaxID=941449 RepID=UPI000358F165|nr:50S ribosomal protein L30 [Desulfovibrio sp. X2]EPR42638.1 ribosomal protein L30 [Desulfovibrio sp. X2]